VAEERVETHITVPKAEYQTDTNEISLSFGLLNFQVPLRTPNFSVGFNFKDKNIYKVLYLTPYEAAIIFWRA
jgi:hypothetical protein